MSSAVWLLTVLLGAQSLGEIAEREKKRREENRDAGVQAPSYTVVSGTLAREAQDSSDEDRNDARPRPASEPDGDLAPMEEARERGEILEPRMQDISSAADRVDRLYQRYMNECYGRYAVGATPPGIGIPSQGSPTVHVGAGRNWFVVLDSPTAFTTPVQTGSGSSFILVETPQCESLRNQLVTSAQAVRHAMRELLELARRESILPGVVRELREKYRLEWSGWER